MTGLAVTKKVTYTLESSLGSSVGLLGALRGGYVKEKASAIALIQNSQNLLLHDAERRPKSQEIISSTTIVRQWGGEASSDFCCSGFSKLLFAKFIPYLS